MVNLAARVSGLILSAPFREGSIVQKGELLFEIDPAPFQADLDSKLADITKAQAQVAFAQVQLERYAKMLPSQAVSQQDYDNAKASLQQAQATLQAANAAAETSRLNLQWTKVTAPIAGRVGRKLVTEGNLVNGGAGPATQLTTITSVDPMYCYVEVDEHSFMRYEAAAAYTLRSDVHRAKIPCLVRLTAETDFEHKGTINFVDNQVDSGTGTVRMRGVIPNPQGVMIPGLSARMRIPAGAPHRALLIPDVALTTNQNIWVVLVVGPDDVVQQRTVQLGGLFGTMREITHGLTLTDRVIVKGLMQVRSGTKVRVRTETPVTAPTTSATVQSATTRQVFLTRPTTERHP